MHTIRAPAPIGVGRLGIVDHGSRCPLRSVGGRHSVNLDLNFSAICSAGSCSACRRCLHRSDFHCDGRPGVPSSGHSRRKRPPNLMIDRHQQEERHRCRGGYRPPRFALGLDAGEPSANRAQVPPAILSDALRRRRGDGNRLLRRNQETGDIPHRNCSHLRDLAQRRQQPARCCVRAIASSMIRSAGQLPG
jgi:hypothetical protein